MKTREIIPFKQPLNLTLALPGSKSITNRAFLCAALAEGISVLSGALESDDTQVMKAALAQLGVRVEQREDGALVVHGNGGHFPIDSLTFDLHNAGTATRFLTAAMCLRSGETTITGSARMKERPIRDLVDGLRQMGPTIEYLENEGYPPLKITNTKTTNHRQFQNSNNPIQKKSVVIKMKGDKSSQYFSAILMMAPLWGQTIELKVEGTLVSKPYIDTTLAVMKAFGVVVQNHHYQSFIIEPQKYRAADYLIEGDASAASYFLGLQYLHGGRLTFTNLDLQHSIQGDARFPWALEQLKKPGDRTIDMNAMPDVAMTLAVLAPFAEGITTITGLSTLRIKETDRLAALENELKKVGVTVETTSESITIYPIEDRIVPPKAGTIQLSTWASVRSSIRTYNDHRMAMCFAVLGSQVPGVVIQDPDCVNKTYPEFWKDFSTAYFTPVELGDRHLVLTGMRGVGKTYYAQQLAKVLNRRAVDLDDEIEKAAGMSIFEIVQQQGWDRFREIEQKMCSYFNSFAEPLVIATGGGVVFNPHNIELLKQNGWMAFLFADPSVLLERRQKQPDHRPPFRSDETLEQEIERVWNERRNLYLDYADVVWDDSDSIFSSKIPSIF
ncbi:3-phosphoshikimate 1-carboxyvinyltransferase [Candidatus Peregrinibacteria bacterium]|nr:MAG: 3-phosphoshikimate 1-carboxyvinyltransferase [Candidatus Peregrinibacteria bacterium]